MQNFRKIVPHYRPYQGVDVVGHDYIGAQQVTIAVEVAKRSLNDASNRRFSQPTRPVTPVNFSLLPFPEKFVELLFPVRSQSSRIAPQPFLPFAAQLLNRRLG